MTVLVASSLAVVLLQSNELGELLSATRLRSFGEPNPSIEGISIAGDDYFDDALKEARGNTRLQNWTVVGPDTEVFPNITEGFCRQRSRRKDHPGKPGVPVQYIHIPKAGGTTIQISIRDWTTDYEHYAYGSRNGNWSCPGNVGRGILYGHRGFGFCRRMVEHFGSRAFYIVSIREPVSHFRSFFDYTMENLADPSSIEYRLWHNRMLSDLVEEYNHTLSQGLSPTDSRMRGPLRFLNIAKQQTAFMCGYDCIATDKGRHSDEVLLANAFKNLNRTDVVVVMENLDDIIVQLKFHVDWVPSKDHRLRKTNEMLYRKKSKLSREATKIITDWSRLDLQLYELAKRRHAELTYVAEKCKKII